ncbi:MAG TPA: hypothetical protein VHO25_16730 [Polyangiaceae bacterium]|nr:hypothetical protein [Polyangiaceae bacterium]
MAAFISVEAFLGRLDPTYAADLTSAPNDEGETVVDNDRIQRAVDDGAAELRGFINQLPADKAKQLDDDTKALHNLKVSTYLLMLSRPGKEYEQIRNAYTDTIQFYKDLILATQSGTGGTPIGFSSCAPEPAFTERNMKGFVP